MRRARALHIILVLVALSCIVALYEVRVWLLKEHHLEKIRETQDGFEHGLVFIAEDLAEHQASAGHATYLMLGLPHADESRHGFPLVNLGCFTDPIRETFVNAYDGKLETLAAKVVQPQRPAEAARRDDGRE